MILSSFLNGGRCHRKSFSCSSPRPKVKVPSFRQRSVRCEKAVFQSSPSPPRSLVRNTAITRLEQFHCPWFHLNSCPVYRLLIKKSIFFPNSASSTLLLFLFGLQSRKKTKKKRSEKKVYGALERRVTNKHCRHFFQNSSKSEVKRNWNARSRMDGISFYRFNQKLD